MAGGARLRRMGRTTGRRAGRGHRWAVGAAVGSGWTGGGVRGRRAGRRPRPYARLGPRRFARPEMRVDRRRVARKTGGSQTPPLRKTGRGRGVVGETLRRRDTWADCGEWLRVDSRHEDTGWPNRRTLRLQGYDYSQAGAYAVTICTHDGAFLFGYVADGAMHLSAAGRVVERVWDGLPEHYPHVGLDVFVVMPDHVHGVIVLADVPLPDDDGIEANRRPRGGPDASTGRRVGHRPAPTQERGPTSVSEAVGGEWSGAKVRGRRVGHRPTHTREQGRPSGHRAISGEQDEAGLRGRRAGLRPAPTKSVVAPRHGLSEVVRGFKSFSGRRVNELRGTFGIPVWQRGYYEHVVRNEEDLNRIREYIEGNPLRWLLRREDQERGLGEGGSG